MPDVRNIKNVLSATLLFCHLCIGLIGCKGSVNNDASDTDSVQNEPDSIEEESIDTLILLPQQPVSKLADELFDDFFYNFISDVRFQHQRLGRTLSKNKGSIFERFSTQDFFTVMYDDKSDLSLLKDTTLTCVGVEWIQLDSMLIDRYNFRKLDGKWILTDKKIYSASESPCSDFLEFYYAFASDKNVQLESLANPVSYYVASYEDVEAEEGYISVDEWAEFSTEMPAFKTTLVSMDYGQRMSDPTSKRLLFQGFSNGVFVDYHFMHIDGHWVLQGIEL